MRNLSLFNKFVFISNIIVTVLTVAGYILPFLAPKLFPVLSVLTLFLPVLMVINILFLLYWMFQLKKQVLLSAILFILGLTFFTKFYKFSGRDIVAEDTDITIMSYNVRLFNYYDWMPNPNVTDDITDFIASHEPTIVAFQEYTTAAKPKLEGYKYKYINVSGKHIKSGQAIYSKYPIVNKGEIIFEDSDNNAIYADIKIKRDTIRVYSMHMQSVKISEDIQQEIDEKQSKKILLRIAEAFTKQQQQGELISQNKLETNLPIVICGDMNNSAYSYVYRTIKGNLKDAFEEAGSGFGKTFNFEFFPIRIDYILVDKRFIIKSFKNFSDFKNSDHFPVFTRLNIKREE